MRRRSLLRLAATAPLLGAAAPPFTVREVAPGIHVRQGVYQDATAANDDAIANIGFIVGGEAIAVIDPGGSRRDGELLHAAVRAASGLPIRYVIMSHVHPDHVFGGGAFRGDGAVFVGHARLPGALAERGEYYRRGLAEILGPDEAGEFVVPSLLVADTAQLDLGGRVLALQAHGAAHTDNDLTILDQRTATLWAADLLFVQRIPSLDGSLTGWLKVLQSLKALPATRAVPGHGPPCVDWPQAAADEERYLNTLLREVRTVIAGGGDIDEAVRTVGQSERGRWALFDDYNGRNVTVAYKELEWE